MGELDICPRTANISTKKEIVGVMAQDTEVGLKISSIIHCSILDKSLMAMGEMDIGLRPSLLSLIIQVILVDHRVFILMLMKEMYIGLKPNKFIHITMVKQTWTNQGLLKKLFQGMFKEKIKIKIILIFLIQEFQHTLTQAWHNILITTFNLILFQ